MFALGFPPPAPPQAQGPPSVGQPWGVESRSPPASLSWAPAPTAPTPLQSCVSASRHSTPFSRWPGLWAEWGCSLGSACDIISEQLQPAPRRRPPDCRGAGSSSHVASHLETRCLRPFLTWVGDLSPLTPTSGGWRQIPEKRLGHPDQSCRLRVVHPSCRLSTTHGKQVPQALGRGTLSI